MVFEKYTIPSCPRCVVLETRLSEARAENARLAKQVGTLAKRVDELEAQARRSKRQAAPFGRDKKKANPKKPGRRPGEGRWANRPAPPQDQVTDTKEVPLNACPHCQGALTDPKTHDYYQIDFPLLPKVETIHFVTHSGYCNHCHERVRSSHPEQVGQGYGAASSGIGPNLRAFGADLKQRLGISYAKISELFSTMFDITVSPSALCQSDARLAKKAEPIYEEIRRALRFCQCVHADETGWRIGALSAWLWTFTNQNLTLYTVDPTRSHEVVLRILGRDFPGTLTADCFAAYDHKDLIAWLQQKCFSHLLKDLKALREQKTRGAVRFASDVAAVLRDAMKLKADQSHVDPSAYLIQVAQIEARMDALIATTRHITDPDNLRMTKRLRKQRKRLFTFLTHEGVEATNNAAERSLRPAVITRKTGGCNKTQAGAKTHAILSSLLVTARQQSRNTVHFLRNVLTGAEPVGSLTSTALATTGPGARSP